MIARIGHVNPVLRIHANSLGPIELSRLRARFADDLQQPSRDRIHRQWRTILPLPFRRGEGWTLDFGFWTQYIQRKTLHSLFSLIFAHEDFAPRIHRHGSRQSETSFLSTLAPPLRHQRSIRRVVIHPLVVRFDYDNVSVAIPSHSFGFAQRRLPHLPRQEKCSVRREFLDPARHIHRINVVLKITRERAWLVEFADADATRTDDNGLLKKPAL